MTQLFLMRRLPRLFVVVFVILGLACASSGRKRGADLPDPLSRMEVLARILVLEDSRSLGEGSLLAFLQHEDPAIRRRAALAAGRIGDPLAVPRLIQRLPDPEVEVRRSAAFALGLIGDPEAVPALTALLADRDATTRGRAAEALSRIAPAGAGTAIAAAFRRALPTTGPSPLRIRGDDPGRADDPWVELRLHLVALARVKDAASLASAVLAPDSTPLVDWWVCVWAAMRIGDARLAPILLAGAAAEDPYIRSLAAQGLGALKDMAHLGVVRRLVEDKDPGVALQALRALAATGSADGATQAAPYLDSPNPVLRREALLAIGALPPSPRWRSRVIENVGHPDPWIRSAAWPALIRIDGEDAGIVLATSGPDMDWRVRQAVARALAESLGERAAPFLFPMLNDHDPRVVAAVLSAFARARGLDAVPTLEDHLRHPDMGIRIAAVEGLASLAKLRPAGFAEDFARAYDSSVADPDIQGRIAVVEVVAKEKSETSLSLLRRIAGSDPSRAVRWKAAGLLAEGFPSPEETSLRMADARRLVSVFGANAEGLYSPHVLVSTRYGRIEMVLDLVDAPLTSLSFVRLAQGGFFNGLTFHRVVPGFVIQGGDPRGDGHGGPGATIRCEYNERPYGRGAVGMALSGKDTGGSQFFITLQPQPHLDGSYTRFGQVLSGMEVVEKIRPGDVIDRVDVFDGREIP
jgi:cyclophilin family peptidyl-prolyl cis-trans isomerase/HEAT repeat protein